MEQMCGIEHVGFLLCCAGAEQHGAMRYAHAHGEQSLEHSLIGVVAQTAYFAGRSHIDTKHGVGTTQTRE